MHLDGLAALLNRFVRKLGDEKKLRKIGVYDRGNRIQVYRLIHFRNCLFVSPHETQVPRIPMMSSRIAGAELHRPLEFPVGSREIPVVSLQAKGKRSVCFAETIVELKSFSGRRESLG